MPSFLCNTDAFWIEGPRSNLASPRAAMFDPERMDAAAARRRIRRARVGVDWPGDFSLDPDGQARRRARTAANVAHPFWVYCWAVGIIKPELFAGKQPDVFRLAPFFFEAARKGRLFGLRLDGLWLHVGRPESIAEAERAIDRSTLWAEKLEALTIGLWPSMRRGRRCRDARGTARHRRAPSFQR